jgi:Tol biopolymer transport system component
MKKILLSIICLIALTGCVSAPQRFGVIFRYSADSIRGTQDIYRIPDNIQDKIEQLTFTTPDTTVDYAIVSPKGDTIIFGMAYSPFLVYLLNLNTKEVKDVSDRFGAHVFPAAWSPDQKQFATLSGKEGYLGIMDIDGGNKKELDLSSLGEEPRVDGVSWLPDGKELVFQHLTNVYQSPINSATFLYNLLREQLTQLTGYDENCGAPELSPSGKQIVVRCRLAGDYKAPPNLQIINISNPSERYGEADLKSCNDPDWSPDGKQIMAVCLREGFGLFVINSDGTGFHEIKIKNSDNFAYLRYPVWSPDGRQIVYIAGDDWNRTNIYSVNLNGSNNHPLTFQPGEYSVLSVYPLP